MNEGNAQETAMPVAGAPSPGVLLAAARRAQNLGIDEVARQLRLSVAQVEALESDAYDKLPGPVFVRGFTRNYARLLGVDADILLKNVDTHLAASTHRISVSSANSVPFPQGGKSRMPYYAVVVLALVAGLVWYEFHWTNVVQVDTRPATTAVSGANTSKPVSAVVADTIASVVDTPALPATLEPVPTPKSEGRVHIVFVEAAWAEVRDGSGAVLLSQTQAAGTERTLEGTPPLSLVIGNARAVRVTYNDKPVDLAQHIDNTVARITLK